MTGSPGSTAAGRRFQGMRSRMPASFDKTCTIETPPTGPAQSNGAGGWIERAPTLQNDVHCEVRFPKAAPNSPTNEAAESTIQRAEIRLPLGTPVSIKSRIVVEGFAYEVQGHDTGKTHAAEIVCDCIRVNDGEPL